MSRATQESRPRPRWRRWGRSTIPLTNTAVISSPTHPIQALALPSAGSTGPPATRSAARNVAPKMTPFMPQLLASWLPVRSRPTPATRVTTDAAANSRIGRPPPPEPSEAPPAAGRSLAVAAAAGGAPPPAATRVRSLRVRVRFKVTMPMTQMTTIPIAPTPRGPTLALTGSTALITVTHTTAMTSSPPRAGTRDPAAVDSGRSPLFAGHHGDGLFLEVDERLTGDVDDRLGDGAAGEGERVGAGVVGRDRLARVLAHVQALADQREVARLGHDPALADLLVVDEQGQRHGGRQAVALLDEGGRQQHLAGRDLPGGLDRLLVAADEVVDVLELSVLDVQGVAAEAGAVREQHPGGVLGPDVDLDGDAVAAVADVGRRRLRHLGRARVVDVLVPGRGDLGPGGVGEDLHRRAVLQRQAPVFPGLMEPEADQLLQLGGMLGRQVVGLGGGP